MRILGLSAVFVSLICLPSARAEAKAAVPDALQITMHSVTPEIESAASKAMQDCRPQGKETHKGINKNGVYALTGDFFHTGHVYAVLDNKKNLIICEWQKNQWKPMSAIDLDIVWKFQGWNRDTDGPREPEATKPFWMLTLQGHQLLAVASEVLRHGLQSYIVILVDSNFEKILDTTDSLHFAPEVKLHYLVTSDQSQGKAEWDTKYFSKIRNEKFTVIASWSHICPYNRQGAEVAQEGDDCFTATVNGKEYGLDSDFSKTDHPADWVVSGDFWDGGSKAKLYFTLKNAWENADAGEKEIAYIFEKVTGLPRELYGIGDSVPLNGKIESKAKIKVVGSKEAVKRLSPQSPSL